jgi:hypothetical protein
MWSLWYFLRDRIAKWMCRHKVEDGTSTLVELVSQSVGKYKTKGCSLCGKLVRVYEG